MTNGHEFIFQKFLNIMKHKIFVTGGSGYIGRAVIPMLINHGHKVCTLVRYQSLSKVSPDCEVILGNVLDNKTYENKIFQSDTLIHLVGVSHPNPFKKELFF